MQYRALFGPTQFAQVNGIRVAYEVAGQGYPLMLIHGFPRTRWLWRKVAPLLTSRFTVVAADLRGYGETERPAEESSYNKRTMAKDHLALAKSLGWDRFLAVGHDRGASVARRLAMDHPEALSGCMILDNLPIEWSFAQDSSFARNIWHWYLFLQRGFADRLLGEHPEVFFSLFLGRRPHLEPDEMQYFIDVFCEPGAFEGVLGDYRTGFDIDRPEWEADNAAGRRIQTPVYLLWGATGPARGSSMLDLWRPLAADVRGEGIPNANHYFMETQPEETVRHILKFADELGLS